MQWEKPNLAAPESPRQTGPTAHQLAATQMEQQQLEMLEMDERLMREAMEEMDQKSTGAAPWQPQGLNVRGMSIYSDSQMKSALGASELAASLAAPRYGNA